MDSKFPKTAPAPQVRKIVLTSISHRGYECQNVVECIEEQHILKGRTQYADEIPDYSMQDTFHLTERADMYNAGHMSLKSKRVCPTNQNCF